MPIEPYDFDVVKLLKQGFKKIEGIKQPFVMAFLLYIVVAVVVQMLLGVVFPSTQAHPNIMNQQIVTILSYPILTPILVGIMMMAIKHERKEEGALELSSIFSYYKFAGTLSMASLIIYLFTMFLPLMILFFPDYFVGLSDGSASALLVLGGIFLVLLFVMYLSIAYIFTLPLIVDKGLGAWDAMELSRKAVSVRFGKMTWVITLLSLIIVAGLLSFGLGLIWAIPLFFVTMYGMLYNNIFEEEC